MDSRPSSSSLPFLSISCEKGYANRIRRITEANPQSFRSFHRRSRLYKFLEYGRPTTTSFSFKRSCLIMERWNSWTETRHQGLATKSRRCLNLLRLHHWLSSGQDIHPLRPRLFADRAIEIETPSLSVTAYTSVKAATAPER